LSKHSTQRAHLPPRSQLIEIVLVSFADAMTLPALRAEARIIRGANFDRVIGCTWSDQE
jgi:hypothetical protein